MMPPPLDEPGVRTPPFLAEPPRGPAGPEPPPLDMPDMQAYKQHVQQGPPAHKDKWYQKLGHAVGLSDDITHPNLSREREDYAIQGEGMKAAAGIEQDMADAQRKQSVAGAQIGSANATAEWRRAQREKLNQPEPGKPITVAAGAKVIMPDGTVIDNPRPTADQRPVSIPRGGSVLMPDGKVVEGPQIEQRPIILPPGSKMVDATGKVIAEGNTPASATQDSYSPVVTTDDEANVTAIPFNRRSGKFGEPSTFEGAGRKTKNTAKTSALDALRQGLGITGGAPPPPPAPARPDAAQAAPAPQSQYKPGDVVKLRDGRTVTIKAVLPNGEIEF